MNLLAAEEVASAVAKKSKTPKPTEAVPKPKASKKAKAAAVTPVAEDDAAPTTISKASKKKVNGAAKPEVKKKAVLPSDFDDSADESAAEQEDDEGVASDVDDQTEALLKGFESDDDEAKVAGQGLEEGQSVPEVPKLSKADKKLLKNKGEDSDKPGVVYVGRIPHGFYEYEMREYFKQFGTITKLRLSRNRKTGASRHYAFIQFESLTVADIVARTMDNYLLFGHILKVKTVSDEQLSPDIWKGANKRFKKVPWNKLEGRRLKQGASEDVWEKRNEKEEKRRADKKAKLDAMDYEFEQPKLKSAKGVAKSAAIVNGEADVEALENGTAEVSIEEPKAIEAAVEQPKKGKKAKPVKATETVIEKVIVAPVEAASEEAKPKGKKAKAVKVTETVVEEVEAVDVEAPKSKKETKKKVVEASVVDTAEVAESKPALRKSKRVVSETITASDAAEKPKKAKKARKSM